MSSKIEETIEFISNQDFTEVVQTEAVEYLENNHEFYTLSSRYDDKKFIMDGLKRFINKGDKILYLIESINFLNRKRQEAEGAINPEIIANFDKEEYNYWDIERYQSHNDLSIIIKRSQSQIFYAVRELEKLGLKDLDKSAFSASDVNDLTRKINSLLIKIDELSVGQEVIYNFIDELKGDLKELTKDFPLGKKRWHQRFSGIVASYLGNKGADALYDLIKPDIMKILQEVKIEKLLY